MALRNGAKRYGFIDNWFGVPGDERWHAVYLRFNDLEEFPAHRKLIEGLNLGAIDTFELGFNSQVSENTMKIVDFHLVPLGAGAAPEKTGTPDR